MNAMTIAVGCFFLGGAVCAQPAMDVVKAAQASFANMPDIQVVERIDGHCGADHTVNPVVAYCTSENVIYAAASAFSEPSMPYEVAHAMGHAAQVRHGVADVALATIRANPADEAELRDYVTQQVECLAGVFIARSGLAPANLSDWFEDEPFTDSHWGRNPLARGPKVSIGREVREIWFAKGQSGQVADCAVPVFGADFLIAADQR